MAPSNPSAAIGAARRHGAGRRRNRSTIYICVNRQVWEGGRWLEGLEGKASLKLQHHDLRVRAEAQRRSPSAGSARGEHLHLADPAEPVDKLAIDPAGHPAPGDELSDMGMAGKLQRYTCGFGNLRMIGGVGQQNAGALAVDA